MPGMKALHEHFGTRKWEELCEPAVRWATEGAPVHTFQYGVFIDELPSNTYFPSGRDFFTPGGFTPNVGEIFRNAALAETMRRVQKNGPDDFTTGQWARDFVAEGNRLGWPVKLEHLTAIPPRWEEPLSWTHRGNQILQLAPPERPASSPRSCSASSRRSASATSVRPRGRPRASTSWRAPCDGPSSSSDTCRIRRSSTPRSTSGCLADHHKRVADILKRSLPKVDLTEHVRVTAGIPALVAAGLPVAAASRSAR